MKNFLETIIIKDDHLFFICLRQSLYESYWLYYDCRRFSKVETSSELPQGQESKGIFQRRLF